MITAFINLKGGSTKSSSAVHLCRYLLDKNKTVALVDADSQATSSTWINNLEHDIPRPKIYRLTEPDPLLDEMPAIANSVDCVVIDGAGGLAEVQRTILLLATTAREVLSAYNDVPLPQAEIPQRQVAADVMGQGATLFDFKTRPAKEVANFYRQLFDEAFNYGS